LVGFIPRPEISIQRFRNETNSPDFSGMVTNPISIIEFGSGCKILLPVADCNRQPGLYGTLAAGTIAEMSAWSQGS
jgi:hypothetical protein